VSQEEEYCGFLQVDEKKVFHLKSDYLKCFRCDQKKKFWQVPNVVEIVWNLDEKFIIFENFWSNWSKVQVNFSGFWENVYAIWQYL